MNITKKHLDDMERCYCTGHITIDGELYAMFASEQIGGVCYAYTGSDLSKREVVWEKAGGTMSIIEIPGSNGQFLGIQNFFPGFLAEHAKIVWGKRDAEEEWSVRDFLNIPYIHRFDILSSGNVNYFVAATLCGSKQNREDWSDPGKVYFGVLPDTPEQKMMITPLLGGMVKNHGYCRSSFNGRPCGIFTCESGIYAVLPPETPSDRWTTHHILDVAVSDAAVYDLDGDGEDEIVTIEPFHGNCVRIYHKSDDKYRVVYTYPGDYKFAHAIWAGQLRNKPTVILGTRRMDAELAFIQYCPQSNSYIEVVIEKGGGPSNISVISQQNHDIILCANNSINEAVAYFVSD